MKNSINSAIETTFDSGSGVIASFNMKAIPFLLLMVVAITSQAATRTWTGFTNSDWNNPDNWSPSGFPNPSDDIVIPDVTNDPVLSNTATIKSLTIESGGYLTISAPNGSLHIGDASNNGIDNAGQLDNYGSILIGQNLSITSQGISNDGTFNNEGTITISDCGTDGIYNNDTFSNDGGTVNIDDTGGKALYNDANADFDNLNNAEIWIGQNTAISGNGIFNGLYTVFTNDNSDIHIDNIPNAVAVNNKGEFNNQNGAVINIGKNDGFIDSKGWLNWTSSGQLTNDDSTINIGDTEDDGIENKSQGQITNQNGAHIKIGQNGDYINGEGIDNFSSGTTFTNNNATITIDRPDNGIYNSTGAQFDNLNGGLINIGINFGDVRNHGIRNEDSGTVFNNDNSTIKIDNTDINGIRNNDYGQFNNTSSGTIEIGNEDGNIQMNGIQNYDNGTVFTNDNSTIQIDNAPWGISNLTYAQFDNLNGANIQIKYSTNAGINNQGDGTVFTNDNSTIKIDYSDLDGIANESAFNNINNAEIKVGQNGGNIGRIGITLYNSTSIFTNDGSSTVEIDNTGTVETTLAAIWMQSSSQLKNWGQITIGAYGIMSLAGIKIVDSGSKISNYSGASLTSYYDIEIDFGTLTNQGGISCEAEFLFTYNATVNGDGNYFISDDWTNSGTFEAGTSTVTFTGNDLISIKGSSSTTFYNLQIDKSAKDVQLSKNTQVDNELQMTSGNLNLNGNDLTLGTSNGTIIGESASSYIYSSSTGEVIKESDLNAPNNENPGNIGTNISSNANLGTTIIKRGCEVQDVNGETSIVRYYDISPTNNSGLDAYVQFSYLEHELNGIAENDLAPFRYNGVDWDEYSAERNTTANWVAAQNVDAFSTWTLAESVAPLPVELISFSARPVDNEKVHLEWQTASELNNDFFEVERSRDGLHFTAIGLVEGNGNSNTIHHYQSLDKKPFSGKNYYRLRQVDFGGTFDYSDIKVVEIQGPAALVTIYPNPASDIINIDFSGTISRGKISIFDQASKMILNQLVSEKSQMVQLHVRYLPRGMYHLKMEGSGLLFHQKIVLQ